MTLARRTRGLEFGDRALEWLCGAVMLSWAYTLSLPGDTLTLPPFAAFHRYGMTEDSWTLAFAAGGGARLVALWINGRWPKTPYFRVAGAAFGLICWSQIAYLYHVGMMMAATPPVPGVGVYSILAMAEGFNVYRAMHDARYYAR